VQTLRKWQFLAKVSKGVGNRFFTIIQYKYGWFPSLSSGPSKSGSLSIHFAFTNSPQTSSRWFVFFEFPDFLADQHSKLTEKFKNLTLNMCLVDNKSEKQEFSLIFSILLQQKTFLSMRKYIIGIGNYFSQKDKYLSTKVINFEHFIYCR
jgi:hypothetical protein